jgi:hypothetical protein
MFVLSLCAVGGLLSAGLLSSCAYTETMNERNREGVRLQNELNYEVERNHRLSQ